MKARRQRILPRYPRTSRVTTIRAISRELAGRRGQRASRPSSRVRTTASLREETPSFR
jgi:hypothetical protein